ncbi:hypothetical protein [Azospirillum himalayense]|uniref:Uncharacterized protein n=1 Tax=Azospirillum himalayense TaxID=654847 RepID=A0ABW0G530_9PROT
MAKLWTDKASFGAGELSPNMARRSDTQQHADGARRMRNVRALNAGGFTRRPGSLHLREVKAGTRPVEFTFAVDQQYLLLFSAGRVDAVLVDGSDAGSVTGCPWTAADVAAMTWVQSGDTVFLFCRSWRPQVLRRVGAAAWALEAWTADEGPGGALKQPYTKFAGPVSTIQPSAYSGSVVITASEVAFAPGHQGQRIRYVGCEMLVTSFLSPTQVTATVLQELPPSQALMLENAEGFSIGHIIEGEQTAAKGEVVNVDAPSGTVMVLITKGRQTFKVDEPVTSPQAKTKILSVAAAAPLPARDWDEPYLSPVYGWPAAGALHRQRLWVGGHTRLPSSVLASRVGSHYDFDIGTGEDADAIFEDLGDSAVAWVRHFHSAEHLLILTDQGVYYVPETAANPLRPSSIQFNKIGSNGCGATRPQAFDEGALYVHLSGGAVMDIRPTGDMTKSWTAADVALLASHLIRQPVDIAATHGADGLPERYAIFVNGDGTLAVMHSIQSQQVLGWGLWETEGAYRSVAVLGGTVFAIVERVFNGVTRWCLERFDQALTTDGAVILPAGSPAYAPLFAGMQPHARAGTHYLGHVDAGAYGLLADLGTPTAPTEVGRFYRPLVEPLPPEPKLPNGGTAGHVKRICRVRAYVQDSVRVQVSGRAMDAYRVGEDVTVPPPLRTEWIEVGLLGRSREPSVIITQDEPLPMTILGMSMEVII